MDDDRESTITEIEALESIFIHELNVSKDCSGWPQEVSIHLVPSTGDISEEQYVKFTLVLSLTSKYPNEAPKIQIKNPRGLSEEHLAKIMEDLNKIAKENKGLPVIYRLIEAGKEHLTRSNTPSEACAICLYEFCANDHFTKTECYHYFHNFCLAQHVNHGLAHHREEVAAAEANSNNAPLPKLEIVCPVCRLPISYNHLLERKFPPPQESLADTDYVISKDMAELQEKMRSLYCHQKERGGIIDMEAERNRFLLSISQGPNSNQAGTSESKLPENGETGEERDQVSSNLAGPRQNETKTQRPPSGRHRPKLVHGHRNEAILEDFIPKNMNSNQWHKSGGRIRSNHFRNANKNSNTLSRTNEAESHFEARHPDLTARPSTSQRSADPSFERNSDSSLHQSSPVNISEVDAATPRHRDSQLGPDRSHWNLRRRPEDMHSQYNSRYRKHRDDRYQNSYNNEDKIQTQVYNRHKRKNGLEESVAKSSSSRDAKSTDAFSQGPVDKEESLSKKEEPSSNNLNHNVKERTSNHVVNRHRRKKDHHEQYSNANNTSPGLLPKDERLSKENFEQGESNFKTGNVAAGATSLTNNPSSRKGRYPHKDYHKNDSSHSKDGDRNENNSFYQLRSKRHTTRTSPKGDSKENANGYQEHEKSHSKEKLNSGRDKNKPDNATHRIKEQTKHPPPGFAKPPPPGFENASSILGSTAIKCSVPPPPGFHPK